METELGKPSLSRGIGLALVALSFCVPAHAAPKYQVLFSFNGTNGSGPWGGVILDKRGNVYGATADGGNMHECNGYGCGVVFELTPVRNGDWAETQLYSFSGGNDGAVSYGNLILDASRNLYGTTMAGGAHNAGTAFQVIRGTDGWTEDIIYAFGEQSSDGGSPTAGLVMDAAGNLFGTTPKGNGSNGGTIFRLTRSSSGWSETVIYQFCLSNPTCADGSAPYPGLILDAEGNLYGTTQWGGIACVGEGCGTVYELQRTSGGWKQIVLHRFNNNGKDGVEPSWGALFMDVSGNLYGTISGGGPVRYGTVFELAKLANGHWKESILYDFKSGSSGYSPNAGVVMDKAGNLYGTTDYGGQGCGVIYKLAPKPKGKWKYTVLYSFYGGADGCIPEGNLVLDKKGNLYGSTILGGSGGNGVIFELTP